MTENPRGASSMARTYKPLPRIPLLANNHYSHPPGPPELVHLDDSALSVMTDLTEVKAITIASDQTIQNAQLKMEACNIHMLLVSNKDRKVIGIITTEDIIGEKPLNVSRERKLHRDDILVRMVMTPQEEMLAIDFESIRYAKVGDIVKTLHDIRKHRAIVVEVDEANNQHTIRGLFSSVEISKQLGRDISDDITPAHYLAELVKTMQS